MTRSTREGEFSNGNRSLDGIELGLTNGTIRRLENILQELDPLAEQGKIMGFFTNVKNADKLGGIAGDIHDTIMDYQVCP